MVKLPRYKECFVCGDANSAGLSMQFYRDGVRVTCAWTPHAKHCGYRDRIHGGVIASILDEAMAWAPASHYGRLCYSIDLQIKYRLPVAAGKELRVDAEVTEVRSRATRTKGQVTDHDGRVFATSTGLYVPLASAESEQVIEYLYLDEVDRRVTADDL